MLAEIAFWQEIKNRSKQVKNDKFFEKEDKTDDHLNWITDWFETYSLVGDNDPFEYYYPTINKNEILDKDIMLGIMSSTSRFKLKWDKRAEFVSEFLWNIATPEEVREVI